MNFWKFAFKIFIVWAGIALIFFNWYFVFQAHNFIPLYIDIMLLAVGLPLWKNRREIALKLQSWPLSALLKFIVLGYGMVLFEEIFAAFVNNLNEGFSPALFIVRVLQFWAFNIFAFTSMIFGWYVLARKFLFSRMELFVLAGLWGLYCEKVIFLPPLVIISYAPLVALIYVVIIAPAIWSLPVPQRAERSWLVRYPCGFLVVMVLAFVSTGILMLLRARFPLAFPPCNFIACWVYNFFIFCAIIAVKILIGNGFKPFPIYYVRYYDSRHSKKNYRTSAETRRDQGVSLTSLPR